LKKILKEASTILLFLILCFSLASPFAQVPSVYGQTGPPWLSGWLYRKSHVINYAPNAGTNYQIRVIVHYGVGTDNGENVYLNCNCRDDFGDIRFTAGDGTSLLDYWIESQTEGDNAVCWVEVAYDLSFLGQTIYIYYGNSDASSSSNGDDTFLFYDHFLGASLDLTKWEITYGSPFVSSSYVHFHGVQRIRTRNTVVTTGMMARVKANLITIGSDPEISLTISTIPYPDSSNSARFSFYTLEKYTRTYKDSVGESYPWTYSTGEKIYDIYRNSTTSVVFVRDGTVINTHTLQVPTVDLKIASSCDAADHMDWDFVFVRKYVSPEPAHGSWGIEESASGETTTDSWWFAGMPILVLTVIGVATVILFIKSFKLRRKYRMAKGEEESL